MSSIETIDLNLYDHIIIAFSGGKDSTGCALKIIEAGIDKDKIELWHHDVDGREGSDLMDWPITRDYCQKFADALDLKLYYSWKVGGFEREMLRENSLTAPTRFETPDEGVKQVKGVMYRLFLSLIALFAFRNQYTFQRQGLLYMNLCL